MENMDLLANDMDDAEIEYEPKIKPQVCGICGEHHTPQECSILKVTNQIPDKVIPSKARLTLPDTLEIRSLADGSSSVYTTCPIERGTQFGPFQAKKLFTLHPSIEFPLKVFTDGEEDLSEFFLDTSDENECSWMIFVSPASEFEEQNTMCFQEGEGLYYVTIKDVKKGEPLKVWYSPYYAVKMNKGMLNGSNYEENVTETRSGDIEMILKQQKNITPRDSWSCKFCGKVEKKLSVFALHLLEHYRAQLGKFCTICKESFFGRKQFNKHLKIAHSSNTKKPIEIIQNIQISPPKIKDSVSKDISSVGGPLLLNDIIPDSLDNTSLFLPPTDMSQFDLGSIDNQSMLLENENLNLNMDNILTENVKGLDHFNFDLNESEPEKLVCDICLKSFIKLKSLTMHIEQHTGKYVCHSCNKVFARKESFNHHSCNAFYKEKCPLCDRIFFQKKFLTRHMNAIHKKQFACEKCDKTFTDKIRLENHYCPSVPLDKTKKFSCTICPKIFFKKYSLQLHLARHKNVKTKSEYICAVCNKILNSRSSYMKHAKLHEGQLLKCDMCDKQFKRTDTLGVHKRKEHSAENKEETCTICDKKLKSLKSLNTHMKTHKKDRPYKCDLCQATFRQRSNLTKHSHRHKLFSDKHLEYLFKDDSVEVYHCPKCNKIMKLKSSLQRHMKVFHPDEDLSYATLKPKLGKLTKKLLDEFEMKTEQIDSEDELDLKQTIEDMNFSTDEVNCNDINIEIDKMLSNADNIENFLNDSGDGIVESLIDIANEDHELRQISERYISKEVCLSMPDLSGND